MIIGVTGGIGSGKSTVSDYLRSKGYMIIDADAIAKQIMTPGSQVMKKIEMTFGSDMVDESGHLNRQALADIIFGDKKQKALLDAITFEEIIKKIEGYIEEGKARGEKLIFVDAALMFESGLDVKMDSVWMVYVHQDVRIQRVMERDAGDYEDVLARINSQMDEEEKAERSDVVIYNNDTKEELYRKIDILLADYE